MLMRWRRSTFSKSFLFFTRYSVSSFADMPLQMETQSRVLSVTDIQGKWREKSSRSVWKVTGIVVEKAGVPRLQKQPVVLSDGPNGVAWGNGNLTGNLEDGWLVWRNRRGETTYCWKKLDGSKEEMQEEVKAAKLRTAGRSWMDRKRRC